MNKNQNFIQFTPVDQQPNRHQITVKILGKRKTTSRPKFDSGSERERKLDRDAVALGWVSGWERSRTSGGGEIARVRRRRDRKQQRDREQEAEATVRSWATKVRRWKIKTVSRGGEIMPEVRLWGEKPREWEIETKMPEVRLWEAGGENVRVRDWEAKWEREKRREDWGVRREGWKWKKLVLGEGKKNKNNVVLE